MVIRLEALPIELKLNRYVLQVLDTDLFFALARKQQRTEIDLTCVNKHIWFLHFTLDVEALLLIECRNLEEPNRLVLAKTLWQVLKDHLKLLST
jgi:hypothetical protein